jgi:hypothetical protein
VRNLEHNPFSFWAIVFVFWAVLSCLWAPQTIKAFSHCLRYSTLVLLGYITFCSLKDFKKPDINKYTKLYSAAYILFLAYIAFEVFGPHWVSKYYVHSMVFDKRLFVNAMVILFLLFWPFFLFCQKKWPQNTHRIFLLLGFPFLIFLFLKTQPHAVLFGIGLSTLGFYLSYLSDKWIKFSKFIIMTVCLILPLMVSQESLLKKFSDEIEFLPASYQHRLYIWNRMIQKSDTPKKILFGNGFDFSTTLKGGEQKCFVQQKVMISKNPFSFVLEPKEECKEPISIFSSHPHNSLIQIFVELGIVGIALCMILLWKIFTFIESKKDKMLRCTYFASLISYLTIFFISFGLWQTWMAGLMILMINSLSVISRYNPNLKK